MKRIRPNGVMGQPSGRGSLVAHRRRLAAAVVTALIVASCAGSESADEPDSSAVNATSPASTPSTGPSADTSPPQGSTPPVDSGVEPSVTSSGGAEGDYTSRVPNMAPPTGEPMVVGLINTEGIPGLDLADIRINIEATFDYLNERGGFGGRPLELVTCAAKGSPETSQACAQEIVGQNVELVMLGLDLFPAYQIFDSSNLPVIGLLPILPADFSADALFLTGGNATLGAGMAGVADAHFEAKTIGIISADAPGSNGTVDALTASLDKLGITYESIKGGVEETDAGLQGLLAQANSGDPDLLVTLYDGAGCIGTMRGRTALGITTPVLAPSSCAESEVIDQVGDDALGWIFLGAQTNDPSPANDIIAEIVAPVQGIEPEEVNPSGLGLGGLGIIQAMSIAQFADTVAAEGGEVTGQSIYDYFGTTSTVIWPGGVPVECGRATAYPAICTFEFPVIEYTEDGTLQPAEGLETVSAFEYLP